MKKKGIRKKPTGIAEKVICLLDILNRIDQGLYPSPASLSKELEVTRRSIHRYLEIINFIIPIEYDRERKGYRFSGKSSLKKLNFSEDEMLLMLMFGDSVSHLGTPLKKTYNNLMAKFFSASDGSTIDNEIPMAFNIADVNDTDALRNNFPIIASAIMEKNPVDIKYHAIHNQETTERRVDPYGIVFSEGNWILIGHCHIDGDIRKFDLDRILEIKKNWMKFEPIDFDLKEYIDERWGMYDGKTNVVKLRFSKEIAHLLTRKKKWHHSEKRKVMPSGDVELTLTIKGVAKLKKWIYTWIPNVEVLKPKWLRDEMKEELHKGIELLNR